MCDSSTLQQQNNQRALLNQQAQCTPACRRPLLVLACGSRIHTSSVSASSRSSHVSSSSGARPSRMRPWPGATPPSFSCSGGGMRRMGELSAGHGTSILHPALSHHHACTHYFQQGRLRLGQLLRIRLLAAGTRQRRQRVAAAGGAPRALPHGPGAALQRCATGCRLSAGGRLAHGAQPQSLQLKRAHSAVSGPASLQNNCRNSAGAPGSAAVSPAARNGRSRRRSAPSEDCRAPPCMQCAQQTDHLILCTGACTAVHPCACAAMPFAAGRCACPCALQAGCPASAQCADSESTPAGPPAPPLLMPPPLPPAAACRPPAAMR